MPNVVLETRLDGLSLKSKGKVRDIYELDRELLIVTTDRISAFDVVLPNGIPYKGQVLTAISTFWFDTFQDSVPHHLLTADIGKMPSVVQKHRATLAGRSMLVKKCKVFPVECVARGYLVGSGWKDYQRTGAVCGIRLPAGLKESDKLPEPIFTPATKAETGHDENISFERMREIIGMKAAETLRDKTLDLYGRGSAYARERGLILADTKFEFGEKDGRILLIDEVLTPDSSRYWPADGYAPGKSQPSFDKQFVRDYLETLAWNKQPPGPELPPDVIRKTSEKYLEAYRRLTGKELPRG